VVDSSVYNEQASRDMSKKSTHLVILLIGAVALSLILLLVTNVIHKSNIKNIILVSTPLLCSSLPNFDPGPNPISQITDLDPTIPIDSKPDYIIKHLNGGYESIYYSTEEQLTDYLKTLKVGYCLASSAPPACLVGHYPGEPPGRKPCIVPTPK
jgi:hypothetical protein